MDLEGKSALVTGASKNIGRATAIRLAELGADVGITARTDHEGCQETAEVIREMGRETSINLLDLSDLEEIERAATQISEDLGGVDILVNNASIRPQSSFLNVSSEQWDKVHAVDLRAMFFLSQQVVPHMIEKGTGSIINVLGVTVFQPKAGKSHVITNKSGIVGLTRSLATELGPDGVRVNGLALGPIDTDRDRSNYPNWEASMRNYLQAMPLKRMGKPEEVANTCGFLASDQSSFITGQIIHVNGGLYPASDISKIQ